MVTMARYGRKKSRRGGKSKSIPISIAAPLVATGAEAAKYAMAGAYGNVKWMFTGITDNGDFQGGRLIKTYGPLAAGIVVHKVANKVGVNNIVRRATFGYLSL